MRQLLIAIICASVLAAACDAAARWRRPVRPDAPAARASKKTPSAPEHDTVDVDSGLITVAGFEKTLRSSRESMFVTNHSALPVTALQLDITYKDMSGRMLHRQSQWVSADIPPGETRMVAIASFDRQNLFYYHLSPLPPRATRATPFKVWVEVPRIIHPNSQQQ